MQQNSPRPGIYLVTDPPLSLATHAPERHFRSEAERHSAAIDLTTQLVETVVAAGVSTVQLRWKNVDARYFYDLSLAVSDVTAGTADLIINDRVDVYLAAREAGAQLAGVHIGQTDLHPSSVRKLIGQDAQIGWSVSQPAEIAEANRLADVIDSAGVGVLRTTATKTDAPPPLGFDGIARLADELKVPTTAIGGIKTADIAHLAPSVHNIAVVSALVASPAPGQEAREMVRLFNHARQPGETFTANAQGA